MAIEALSALSGATGIAGDAAVKSVKLGAPGQDSSPGGAAQNIEVRFSAAMDRITQGGAVGSSMPTPVKGLFDALDQVNMQARSVSDYAATAEASGGQLTPGEIVQLTMKCQEFMFQCQLTSNIANRSSDGVQQLFRQQ
jgi:hypothetical protein